MLMSVGTAQMQKNMLSKDCFVKIFKYIGDYARLKKGNPQLQRTTEFGKDAKKYLEMVKQSVVEEDRTYDRCANELLERLQIAPDVLERSQ